MSPQRKLIIGMAAILLAAGSFGIYKYLTMQKELPPENPAPEVVNYVRVNEVKFRNVETEIQAFGRVSSSQPIDLVAEVGGRLLQGDVPLKEGQHFREGQLLIKVNDAEMRLNLQARKSSFLNLIASALPDLKVDYPATYPGWQAYFNSIETDAPLSAIPTAKDAKEKTFLATRNILSEYYSIRSLEETLRKHYMYAPYRGSISAVNLEIGTYVNPGTNIGRILRTDAFEIKVPIETGDIRFVEPGRRVKVMMGEAGPALTGKVVRITDYIDPGTQTFHVFVSVENGGTGTLYDGLYLKVIIPGKMVDSAIEVPRGIVHNGDEVFLYKKGLLNLHEVNVVKSNDNSLLITGLQEGDSLVMEAPLNAYQDMKVEMIK